jgi:hypothetical protein
VCPLGVDGFSRCSPSSEELKIALMDTSRVERR